MVEVTPHVVTHGDCLPKNLHVISEVGEPVVPIDWGSVGIGLLGADLGVSTIDFDRKGFADPDIDTYLAEVSRAWGSATTPHIRRAVELGRICWGIKLVAQSLPGFEHYAAAKVSSYLALYVALLTRSASYLGG
jgi:aminoglycoside phosphotransferase (APT) family kinase protein